MSASAAMMTPSEFAAAYGLAATSAQPGPSTPQFVPYVTGPGVRWDTIAWDVYGDPSQVSALIMANSNLPVSPVLPVGITVYAPVIQPAGPPANQLPWNP